MVRYLIIAFLFFSVALPAESPETGDNPVPSDTEPNPEQPNSNRYSDSVLPSGGTPILGFYDGRITYSSMIGPSLSAPSGSYINAEKQYDDYLRARVYTGEITSDPFGFPARYYNANYQVKGIVLIELEAAFSEHFGAGAGLFTSSIKTRRQELLPFTDSNGNRILDYPDRRTAYSEGGLMGFVSYHPISRNAVDPYLKVRTGITFASGYAHQYVLQDPYVYDNRMSNARGIVYGGSLGLNFYLSPELGLNLELTSLGRTLNADQFSSRTLTTNYATIGFTVFLQSR